MCTQAIVEGYRVILEAGARNMNFTLTWMGRWSAKSAPLFRRGKPERRPGFEGALFLQKNWARNWMKFSAKPGTGGLARQLPWRVKTWASLRAGYHSRVSNHLWG